MRKILYVATSDIHIQTFHIPYLKWLKDFGCELHLAIENRGNLIIPFVDKVFHLPFPRTPFSVVNFSTINALKTIIMEGEYDLIHCHTPIPGALTRLAARKARKKGTKVLYTVHGFHFYKGAGLKNWLIYYPIEWILSAFTDGIITINSEDFNYINGKMRHKKSFYIKGIGIDSTKFKPLNEREIILVRQEFGYHQSDFILLYIAEFIYRKNHKFIIDALPELVKVIPEIKVVFAGIGVLLEKMNRYAKKLKVDQYIDFLGFRNDVGKLAAIADIGISSSRQEGLGLGLAEEMLCSKPIVSTYDRGHKEMIKHEKNGFLFKQGSQAEFIEYIIRLYKNPDLTKRMGKESYCTAQIFRIENSLSSMNEIYRFFLADQLV